jgi:hypothetical protein
MAGLILPSKATLYKCSIGGVDHIELVGNLPQANFSVKEFRIYEDICKSYFTGQLVIETVLNMYEQFLYPTAEVIISFECPQSEGQGPPVYTETFRVYSYDSKPITGGSDAMIQITISLIGQEYYNDRQNIVTQNDKLMDGTTAAAYIHENYMQAGNGPNRPTPGKGMIANETSAHQTMNKKPIKAIHDILDRTVFANYQSATPVYYRDKLGHVMAPLQQQLEQSPISAFLYHIPAAGSSAREVLLGYDNILHMRPLAPEGENSSGVAASDMSGLLKAASQFDLDSGGTVDRKGQSQVASLAGAVPALAGKARGMLNAVKGVRGGGDLYHVINNLHQFKEVDKNGPGGFNVSQEALITALHYSQKYWISCPGQTGNKVTCGQRIQIVFPVNNRRVTKTLFVPRLIHEVVFIERVGGKRKASAFEAKTDLYCVEWRGF